MVPLYGLAAGGRTGAQRVFDILSDELRYTQAMVGCPDCKSIRRNAIMDREQIKSRSQRL